LENGSATFLADASVEIKLNNETVKHYHPQRKAVLARQESEKKTEAVLRYLNPYLWLGIAIVIFVIYNLGPAVIKLLLNKH
jgi:Na+/H+ antiporter NhaC